jgi:protein O-mannosyl-transferase
MRVKLLWPIFIITVLTVVAYWPVIKFDFINFDDPYLVQRNPLLLRGLSTQVLFSSFAGWIHPLTNLTYWVDAHLYGISPGGFHETNLLFHLLATCGLFFWIENLTGSRFQAGVLAMLFAWHPTHVEAVAWVAERNSVVSAAFFWFCLYAHGRAIEHENKSWWFAAWILGFLSLMGKPFALGLPFIFLLIEWWKTQIPLRDLIKRRVVSNLAFGGLVVMVAALNLRSQFAIRAPSSTGIVDLLIRVPQQIAFYIEKSIWPAPLKIIYEPHDLALGLLPFLVIAAGIALSFFGASKSKSFRCNLIFGFGFFILTIAPMLKLIPFGDESPVSDRYLYISQIGLFFPFVCIRPVRFFVGFAIAEVIAALVFLGLTIQRLPDWQDSVAMWKSLLRAEPNSKDAYENLASFYLGQERLDEALTLLERGKTETSNNMANQAFIMAHRHRFDEADRKLKQAEALSPSDPVVMNIRGSFFLESNNLEAAQAAFLKSLATPAILLSSQVQAEAENNLGVLAIRRGEFRECIVWQNRALESSPTYALALYNLSHCYLQLGQLDEAERGYIALLKIQPQFPMAENALGAISVRRGDLKVAEAHFVRALQMDPKLQLATDNLAIIRKSLAK